MKSIIISFILILSSLQSWSQHQISDTDTTLDYKLRFYKNGILDLDGYYVYTLDSASYFSTDTARYYDFKTEDFALDSSKMYRLEHGKCISHYTYKKQKYYSLGEYKGGILRGKMYNFREDGTLYSTFKRYPRIKGLEFNGSQIIYYDKKDQHITKIEYILFNENQTQLFYWNKLYYSSNGKLSYYSYYDEKAGIQHIIDYTKKGEIKHETLRNAQEYSDKKWNKERSKMTLVTYGKETKTIQVYRMGKLVRAKTTNY